MRSIRFIAVLFIIVSIVACKSKTKEEIIRQNAIDKVEEYITINLDHNAYESVSFDTLKPVGNDFGLDTVKRAYKITGYTIAHKYKAKNDAGVLTTHNQKFFLTDKLEVSEVQEIPEK
jgi:hypothetical protein